MLTIGLNKLCIQGNYCPHRRGLTLYLDKSKKYRKSLWTEKQKKGFIFVVVLPSSLYCRFDGKVLYVMGVLIQGFYDKKSY